MTNNIRPNEAATRRGTRDQTTAEARASLTNMAPPGIEALIEDAVADTQRPAPATEPNRGQRAAQRIRAMRQGVTLGNNPIKDLINEGRP